MNINFEIIKYGSSDWEAAVNLREKILRVPLGTTFSQKELIEEKEHIQIAGFNKGTLLATAVLVPEGSRVKMQRVVVDNNYRNRNIGSKMMLFCEEYSIKNDFEIIYCHARDSAVNFYSQNGYTQQGDYFDEDGIPHLMMYKYINS